ncbi:MAG: hypothetical protein LIR40_15625, partial [Bacteroidota bacterium]|nr:hypothetical protein [Bacteroidota bacterium]
FNRDNSIQEYKEILKKDIDSYIFKDVIYYSNRTNTLNFQFDRRDNESQNIFSTRKYDLLQEYLDSFEKPEENEKYTQEELDELKKYIFNIRINEHQNDKEYGEANSAFSHTALQELRYIIKTIENQNKDKRDDIGSCIAIDGFTQLSVSELNSINFSHLERVLRRNACVSILVFDEAESFTKCNADLVIEMNRVEDLELKYTFHQLRIAKSVFQQIAYGWHQYKVRDYGVEVFQSTHLLMQKRRYMQKLLKNATYNVIDYTDEFLYMHNDFESFEKQKLKQKEEAEKIQFNEVFNNVDEKIDSITVLNSILVPPIKEGEITALIGPSNSCKRMISMGYLCASSLERKHSIIVLLDAGEKNMLNQILCPAIKKEQNSNCIECYKYLHIIPLRMGCIGSDELFHYLGELISFYGDNLKRIVFGDLIKIDYSFPMLKRDSLFLPALITFLKNHNIDSIILSSNEALLAPALKSLADNVILSERLISVENKSELELQIVKSDRLSIKDGAPLFRIKNVNDVYSCLPNDSINNKRSLSVKLESLS